MVDSLVRYRIDIRYDCDEGYDNGLLLQNLLKKRVDVNRIVHYDE